MISAQSVKDRLKQCRIMNLRAGDRRKAALWGIMEIV